MYLVRLDDSSDHGGRVISAAQRVYCAGRPVARVGDLHACPVPGHGVTEVASGSVSVYVEGRPVARHGDVTGCGARLVASQETVSAR